MFNYLCAKIEFFSLLENGFYTYKKNSILSTLGNYIPVDSKDKKMSESERFAHMFDKSIGLVRKWSEIRVGLMAA